MATPKKPLQQGLEDSMLNYYDIMVIGKTGAGKSTTVDKLLIAWLPGQLQEQQVQPQEELAQEVQQLQLERQPQLEQPSEQPQPGQPQPEEANDTEPVHDPDNGTLQCSNLTMWLASESQIVSGEIRLKNAVFFRSLENSHKEINAAREGNMVYKGRITEDCELFSNELTKIRVLDVPGFFGNVKDLNSDDLDGRMKAVKNYDLFTMRTILGIKTTHNFKFNRIVYFLPEKGSLKRASQELIIELKIIKEYFGRPIFESMVVVATFPSDVYENFEDNGRNLFPESKIQETRKHLHEALHQVFGSDNIPDPPIIFISLFDTCEEILLKVQTAEVKQDFLDLEFASSVCRKCDKRIIREGEGGPDVACCVPGQQGRIPLDESTCHPLMIPKYSKIERILGGIAHVITGRHFIGHWPDFKTLDEKCLNCDQPPNCHGCLKIGSEFKFGKESIEVKHSNSAADYVEVGQDNGEAEDTSNIKPV